MLCPLQKLQLGLGDRKQRNMPCEVPGMADKVCVFGACGKHHTVAVTDDGKAFSWGFNGMGQTGTGEVRLWIRAPPPAFVASVPMCHIAGAPTAALFLHNAHNFAAQRHVGMLHLSRCAKCCAVVFANFVATLHGAGRCN